MGGLLIIGSGAMACLFGAALAPVTPVTLLGSWQEGVRALREHGIRVEDEQGVRTVSVAAATDAAQLGYFAHALVLVKSWQTVAAAERLRPALADDGIALTLQNGLGNLEILQRALGGKRAALGVTTIGATLLGPGRVRSGGEGAVHLAPEPRLEALRGLFEAAGLEVHAAQDLEALVWGKLAVNAGINPLTALLRIPNGALLQRPQAVEVLQQAVTEVVAVMRAAGQNPPWDDPVAETLQVARRTAANRSSMLQDLLRGAPTEIDAICGAVVRHGEELGVPTPVNRTLWQLVRAAVPGAEA